MTDLDRVHAALVEWYQHEARDLPWRRTRDGYAILVAEVMLQQTQVHRVIPKWHAWLAQFPTLADLARASRAEAIRAWHGLGYNLRAVRLHSIACQCIAEFDGELPRTVEGLLRLKGIGRYTAGAVACFAFEQPVAMVDTNVRRVLSRVFGIAPADVESMAASVVPVSDAYAWNQALMDLGASLCRACRPLCLLCPLMAECQGPRAWPSRKSPQGQFHGSSRYYRGRVLAAMRELPPGESLTPTDVASRVGAPIDVVDRLVNDGLLEHCGYGRVRLAEGDSAAPTSQPSAVPATTSLG